MAVGLRPSRLLSSASTSCLFIALFICSLGNFFFTVEARPMSSDGSPPLLSDEWDAEVVWLGPGKKEADSWRAFEPSKSKSSTAWWESEMNDNLWDPNTNFEYPDEKDNFDVAENPSDDGELPVHEDAENSVPLVDSDVEKDVPLSDSSQADESPLQEAQMTKVADINEGESKSSAENEDSEKENHKDEILTDDSSLPSSYGAAGEVDSFIDPSQDSFYSSNSLGERTWKPSYNTKPYLNSLQTDEDEVTKEFKEADREERTQSIAGVKESGTKDDDKEETQSNSEENASKTEEDSVVLGTDKVSLESLVAAELMHRDSHNEDNGKINENKVSTNKKVNEPSEKEVEQQKQDEEKFYKKESNQEQEKKEKETSHEENDVYGKGESISPMREGKALQLDEKKVKSEELKKPVKTEEKFEDWEDWDDSAFNDYYDGKKDNNKKDSGSSEKADENKIGNNIDDKINSDNDDSDYDYTNDYINDQQEEEDEDDDTLDDYYDDIEDKDDERDDDDDDDDDDDVDDDVDNDDENDDDEEDDFDESDEDDEDEEDIQEEDDENDEKEDETDPIPQSIKTGDEPRIPSQQTAQKETKGHDHLTTSDMDLDTEAYQNDASISAKDNNHYNKGTIYDYSRQFHTSKKSVKKDLGNPVHPHTAPLKSIEEQSATLEKASKDRQDPKASLLSKKDNVVTHVQPGSLSTGLESLTSPNPRPTVHTWSDTSQSSTNPIPSTTDWFPSDDVMLGDQPMKDNSHDEDDGYVNSHPLEHCKIDYECRAGRTCVHGLCKCVQAKFCAGHYKPVCGSDGVKYPSHCELHRTACLNRLHIRVDRRGSCFKESLMKKEKSWLLEQERLLEKSQKQAEQQEDKSIEIKSSELLEYPGGPQNDDAATEVKKSGFADVTQKPEATENCSPNELDRFKDNLLMFYCKQFVEPNCKLEVRTDRQYLSMLMFSYYDSDFDFYLTADELDDKERDENFDRNLIKNCHLRDVVKVADIDKIDGQLSVSEFTNAFGLMPSTSKKSNLEIISTLASAGDGLELKCGIQAENIIWKRYGVQLTDDQKNHKLMIFDDGSLFMSELGVHHIGNFTCMSSEDEADAQVHRLSVQTIPVVQLSPIKQTIVSGSDIILRCHAEGIPEPKVTWKFKGNDIHDSDRTVIYHGQDHILIHDAEFGRDNGSYTCSAHNQAGTTEKSVDVNILPPMTSYDKETQQKEGSFIVFHDKGIKVYDPVTCLARRVVPNDFGNFKFIPDAMDRPLTLCQNEHNCRWTDAVKVGSGLIYVSQPDQNRILVIEAGHYWNPLQVIDTDRNPGKMLYVPHLDQVWVLCQQVDSTDNDKTIVVIRDASQPILHRSVHMHPVGNHFDTVKDLFIAPPNDLHHEFDHGYVSHNDQYSLTKVSLEDMSYSKTIDLSNFGCVPQNLAFLPLAGRVIIECVSEADQHTLQLVMDYLTDAIISTTTLPGQPIVSPDARHLVTVDKFTGKVVVVSVSIEGDMETTYEVTVSASISDVSFMPSIYHHGYDLILTSADDDDVVIMNLVTGRVEKMQGSKLSDPSQPWHPSPVFRHIISGDPTSNLLMSPARSSVSILDFRFKQIQCEFTDITGNQVMVHVPAPHIN